MIEGWELPPGPVDGGDVRLVLAELINPSYDLRNISGISRPPDWHRARPRRR